jgi:photosystem II stability/assembly factor-like uncharacterized protein
MTSFSKPSLVLLGAIALLTLGQSCSINVGNTTPKDGGIYRTDNQAENWRQKTFIRTEKNRRISLDDATITFIAIDPHNSERVYAGVRGTGLWKSLNRGEQWAATGIRTGSYRCLDFDPKNDQILYIATGSQIQKSIDQGKTWKMIYTEPQARQTIECVTTDPGRDNILWTVTSGGKIIRSTDFGENWTLVNTVKTVTGVLRLEVDPATSGLVVFTKRGIHRFDASGATATDLTQALSLYKGGTTIADVDVISTVDGELWYLATAFGILTSSDGGVSWRQVSTLLNPNSTAVANIAVNPDNIAEIYLTTGRRLHRTTDAGASWAVTTLPSVRQPVWLTIDADDPTRLYVGTFVPEKK